MKAISIRLDDGLGKEFDKICKKTGYKKNTLLTRLIASFVRHQKAILGAGKKERDPFAASIGLMDLTPLVDSPDKSEAIDLTGRGIDEEQANQLRARLSTFAEEWMSPEMDAYDRYDQSKAKLPTR